MSGPPGTSSINLLLRARGREKSRPGRVLCFLFSSRTAGQECGWPGRRGELERAPLRPKHAEEADRVGGVARRKSSGKGRRVFIDLSMSLVQQEDDGEL